MIAALAAQEKQVARDSSGISNNEPGDSTATANAKPVFQWQKFPHLKDPVVFSVSPETMREIIYEDGAELLSQFPFLQIWRDGDSGLFSHLGINSAPPRFTEFFIDDLPVPAGIWGQSDLTFLPETTLENVVINPWEASIAFEINKTIGRRPQTLFEFVLGPYGSDAVRLRFKRRLTKNWRINWGATFANSEGQWYTPDYGPFEANRVHGLVVRNLRPDLEIRYRFLQSVNKATQSQPFFLDEYPQIIDSKRDQRRFMNSLEIARLVRPADSSKQDITFDKWRIRLFNWHLQEQYSDGGVGFGPTRFIKPQSNYRGMSAFFRQQWRGLNLKYQALVENDQLDNKYFPGLGNYQRANFSLSMRWKRRDKIELSSSAGLKYHSDFSIRPVLSTSLKYHLNTENSLQVAATTKPQFPQPGEYSHTNDSILAANSNLREMQFAQIGAGYMLQKDAVQFFLTAGQAIIRNPFLPGLQDSLFRFENSEANIRYPFVSLAVEMQVFSKFKLKILGNARFSTPDSSYLFAEMPAVAGQAELAYSRMFFQGDLLAQVLVRGRFWLDRYHFYNYQRGRLPDVWQGNDSAMLDVEVRGFFRDAMIFMKFENVMGADDFWRPNVPMRWRTMKWGVSWKLWD